MVCNFWSLTNGLRNKKKGKKHVREKKPSYVHIYFLVFLSSCFLFFPTLQMCLEKCLPDQLLPCPL